MASPREYRPYGEAGMQPRGETDQVNSNKLRIPTLQANNTDPVGKREPFNWRQRTVRCRRWWNRYRLTAVFPGKVRAVRQRPPINDPMRKVYRPCGGRLPTVRGNPANKTPAKGRFRVGLVGLHDVVFVFNVLSC